tara:strand:+ start:225 stop:704 length:480 start_codon:yes stop_codon:yes gene_type:complete
MSFLELYRMKYLLYIIIFLYSNYTNAELLKPSPDLEPEQIITIQLTSLMNNDSPYKNAGIEQTWEFAHPNNRIFTGPLKNFTKMMYSKGYSTMLNHINHKIYVVKKEKNISYFFIELIDKFGNKFGFQWTVEKVNSIGKYNNCWMTTGVSQPMKLSKSA